MYINVPWLTDFILLSNSYMYPFEDMSEPGGDICTAYGLQAVMAPSSCAEGLVLIQADEKIN